MTAPDLATLVEESQTRFILATFVDLAGKPCAKLVPASALDELVTDGVGFAGFAVGLMGQEPKDPDLMVLPDAASFTPLPFIRPGLAMVQCDPHVEGEPWKFAPRVILKKVLAGLAEQNITAKAGAEIEYFLVRRDENGRLVTADDQDDSPKPCYDARGVTRMYEHLTEVSDAMNALGWGNYANDHEDANGQFEQNFVYADALTTADRVVSARYLISMLAQKRDMTATFMPKPFADRTGNGLHFHLSLWRDDEPLFPGTPEDSPFGLSAMGHHFTAGVLDNAHALQAILAPTVNSYKRTGATSTASGASWAPNVATYGGNDRTHYVRIPDNNRIEVRGADGSANPYLALATLLGAGMAGVETELDPGPPGHDTNTKRERFPQTLLDATQTLHENKVVRGALDSCGSGVSEYFIEAKRAEFFASQVPVSEWELNNYLTAF